jgi:hypothetical protein
VGSTSFCYLREACHRVGGRLPDACEIVARTLGYAKKQRNSGQKHNDLLSLSWRAAGAGLMLRSRLEARREKFCTSTQETIFRRWLQQASSIRLTTWLIGRCIGDSRLVVLSTHLRPSISNPALLSIESTLVPQAVIAIYRSEMVERFVCTQADQLIEMSSLTSWVSMSLAFL